MIVVDASIVAPALVDDGATGVRFRARLAGEELVAPELLHLEVCSVFRKLHQRGELSSRRATAAFRDLEALPVRRIGHQTLLPRIWQLRNNVSPYDASYVALAEALALTLLTGDRRLGASPGHRCTIELLD